MDGVLYFCVVNCKEIKIEPIESWLTSGGQPLVIAGPCSAESYTQEITTAKELAAIPQVRVFRAGLRKPRTRPNSFEGVGYEGLEWLKEVKLQTGLLTCVEVATPKHVEASIKNGVDILWVGARTTVNPFLVQEIAESVRGTNIPMMVKNPVNPDLELWLGAIERFQQAGLTKLAAIHRGFSFFRKSPYRNAPMWEIPIEMKRICPSLPVITDPSHMAGRRDLLLPLAQKALDLEMDGLMIEVHTQPDSALTDREQQITPLQLSGLLKQLILRRLVGNNEVQNKLESLRSEIDKLDNELIEILSHRMSIVDEIGRYKKENNITILQLRRWREIIEDRLAHGVSCGLDKSFLLNVLQHMHDEGIRRQNAIMNNNQE